jgi:hypothetical protein
MTAATTDGRSMGEVGFGFGEESRAGGDSRARAVEHLARGGWREGRSWWRFEGRGDWLRFRFAVLCSPRTLQCCVYRNVIDT